MEASVHAGLQVCMVSSNVRYNQYLYQSIAIGLINKFYILLYFHVNFGSRITFNMHFLNHFIIADFANAIT